MVMCLLGTYSSPYSTKHFGNSLAPDPIGSVWYAGRDGTEWDETFRPTLPPHPSSSSSPIAVDFTQPARSSTEPLPSHCRLTQVEVQVGKLYCVSKAAVLPINIEDAARSDVEIEKALQAGETLVRVNQDTCLNNRVLDLRTPVNQGIFRIQSQVGNSFGQFLISEGSLPKLIAGSSEGGAAVFRLNYKGQDACLAQSPQLHKQMAIRGGFGRIFEIGPVFRAEDSFTHRHLCEFTGLDVEMEIKRHYFEVELVIF
ncbi:aspartate--tRNA ligase 1, cytoplasmic-like [Pyrus x bretschneideri]|uniref:aspartate--tRNA ligase 1, cytoplasmic-like n=1 Tax=Pyrus x bretschneideri TaxID=225117 RepID=UPI00202F2774|nr:aspartate--tRNA ligase 1, cytoplasmic-like [Pyrus x bretschneideri]